MNKINADYERALILEQERDWLEAATIYASIVKKNPLHLDAQNRLMIVYRKLKLPLKEKAVIKSAISAYQKKIENDQRRWIKENRTKATLTRDLAKALGLLGSNGLPLRQDETLIKWEKRLSLLEQRMAKANIKTTALKKQFKTNLKPRSKNKRTL